MNARDFVPHRCFHALWLALVTLLGCQESPTGREQILLVPEAEMDQMGEQAFAQILEDEEICFDSNLQQTVETISAEVIAASTLEEEGDFALIDSEMANAFALPGANVGIFTGILEVAETNAGLAAIVAHEIGHVVAQHGAERVSQNLVAELGLSVVDELLLRGSEFRDLAMAALGLGAQVGVLLPFSRAQESEADELGLTWMAEAGYDPRAAVRLWERMAAMSGGGPPEFLSTHPDPAARAEALRQMLPEALEAFESSDQIPTESLTNELGEPITEAAPRCGRSPEEMEAMEEAETQ